MRLRIVKSDIHTMLISPSVNGIAAKNKIEINFAHNMHLNEPTSHKSENLFIMDCIDSAVDRAVDVYHYKEYGSATVTSDACPMAIGSKLKQHIKDSLTFLKLSDFVNALEAVKSGKETDILLLEGSVIYDRLTFTFSLVESEGLPTSFLIQDELTGNFFSSDDTLAVASLLLTDVEKQLHAK